MQSDPYGQLHDVFQDDEQEGDRPLTGTTYFSSDDHGNEFQLFYTPTASSLPHVERSRGRHLGSLFVNEATREELSRRLFSSLLPLPPQKSDLPTTIGHFHSLIELTDPVSHQERQRLGQVPPNNRPQLFGTYQTGLYKAVSLKDGMPYVLRRILGYRVPTAKSSKSLSVIVAKWKRVRIPGVVALREFFLTTEFGGGQCLVGVYDYHPNSETLEQYYFNATRSVDRRVLQAYAVQLITMVKQVHSLGLSCRIIHPSKLILTGTHRIRLSGVALTDAITGPPITKETPADPKSDGQTKETRPFLWMSQMMDYADVAFTLIAIACKNSAAADPNNIQATLVNMRTSFGAEFADWLALLIYPPANLDKIDFRTKRVWVPAPSRNAVPASPAPLFNHGMRPKGMPGDEDWSAGWNSDSRGREELTSANQSAAASAATITQEYVDIFRDIMMHTVGPWACDTVEGLMSHVDLLEGDLAKEIENGRLFRLQSYINMVCNVPVGSVSIGWNDTAERHIIRLFRDYLDHPVDSQGKPILDLGHAVETLNKVEVGSPETVMLVSPDERSVLVVTYADIKRCIMSSLSSLREEIKGQNRGGHSGPGGYM